MNVLTILTFSILWMGECKRTDCWVSAGGVGRINYIV